MHLLCGTKFDWNPVVPMFFILFPLLAVLSMTKDLGKQTEH